MNKRLKELKEKLSSPRRLTKLVFSMFFFFILLGTGIYFIYEYKLGHFANTESLQAYIEKYGVLSPLIMTGFQCIKVVYAVVPGALGCIVGASLFGWFGGFLCSYVGICLGSMIAFKLSRRYGIRIVKFIFSEKRYNACIRWMEKHRRSYPIFLWAAICFPFAPDDFLCYFSGLTTISFKRFAIIVLTAKPWTILVYSLIFGHVF